MVGWVEHIKSCVILRAPITSSIERIILSGDYTWSAKSVSLVLLQSLRDFRALQKSAHSDTPEIADSSTSTDGCINCQKSRSPISFDAQAGSDLREFQCFAQAAQSKYSSIRYRDCDPLQLQFDLVLRH